LILGEEGKVSLRGSLVNCLKFFYGGTILIFSMASNAAYVQGINTTIKSVSAYGSGLVTGDIRITVHDAVVGCEAGYYVKSDNPGKDSILSLVLSAYHSKTVLKINALDAPRWNGSGANYCEVEGIHLQ
jgi:hypothetical protein